MATRAGCEYAIRIKGRLGATALSAFPTMRSEVHGAESVLTGWLEDRSAVFGVLAQIEALGLELIELRRIGSTYDEGECMTDESDWNGPIIREFRANEGRVGGNFEGAPVVLLHHRGRKSGREYVNPLMYLPDETDDDVIFVFATKGGLPTNPDWYYNLITLGKGSVERGTDSYPVSVRELTGVERDRVYAEQARRYPGFADYETRTEGVRTIPVIELTRR